MVHWVMMKDGTFTLTQDELGANNYYQLLRDTSEDVAAVGDDGTADVAEFVVETDVDPYDEVFSITGNELLPYTSDVYESQMNDTAYNNIVTF